MTATIPRPPFAPELEAVLMADPGAYPTTVPSDMTPLLRGQLNPRE